MKKKILISIRLATLFISVISISSCITPFIRKNERTGEVQKPLPFAPNTPMTAPPQKYVQKYQTTSFNLTTAGGEYSNRVFSKLNEEDFLWLEQTAAKARDGKERFEGGYWVLKDFYDGLMPKDNSDAEYEKLFERLERWKKAFPDSITARIAVAEAWQSYAGEARGGGYANTVAEEGWRLFQERMKKSKEELVEAKKLKKFCPIWYSSMMSIAKLEGWNYDDFEEIYQQAIAAEPDFYMFYREKAAYLLPRYHGSEKQWLAYLDELQREKGARIYYLTVIYFLFQFNDIPLQKEKFDWEKMKQGFEELRKKDGVSKMRLNEFAKLSILANDFKTATAVFDEIGENWEGEVWKSKEVFDKYRTIAKKADEVNSRSYPRLER
jgi:hypothetical protein